MADRYAFATLVTSDSYLPGALALAAALKEVHPSPPVHPEVPFQKVCIVTPETVDVKTIKFLRKAFDVVIGVEVIEEELSEELKLLGRPDLHLVLTKLHVFRLVQFEKVIFLDADILPIQPLSHLFALPHDFSAVPDVGWPDIFNSGMMVFSPGEEKFNDIMALVKSKGSWDGGDQGVLNEWRGGDWNRLSFTYNTTPTAAYTYAPAYERFGHQIKALHFIGPNKPWNELPYRAPSSSAAFSQTTEQVSTPSSSSIVAPAQPQSYAYSSLVDRWFAVYDRNYRQEAPLIKSNRTIESRKYENAWDQRTAAQPQTKDPILPAVTAGGALGLEDLRKLAIEGGTSMFQQTGEGEYRSLPLEGRVDLMRPKKVLPPPEIRITSETSPAAQQHGGGNSGNEQPPRKEDTTPIIQGPVDPNTSQYPPSPHISPISLPPSGPPTPRASELNSLNEHILIDQKGQSLSGSINSKSGHQQYSVSVGPVSLAGQQSEGHGRETGGSAVIFEFPEQHRNENQPIRKTNSESEELSRGHGQPSIGTVQSQQYPDGSFSSRTEGGTPSTQTAPSRSASPPLLSWNPAVEPPPNTQPSPAAFPSEAYFPNAWDISPSAAKLHTALTGVPPPTSPSFFEAPAPRQIPSRLIKEGHYRNVMGDPSTDQKQSGNRPDIAKVTVVFPWEQKLRHTPGRVFPEGEVVPNAKYIEDLPPEPEPDPEPESEPQNQATEGKTLAKELPRMHIQMPSPPIGYPGSSGYANAWDAVPSIQKYASRLAKPIFPTNQPLTSVSPRSRKRSDSYMSRGDQSDANSMDGDVEDEVDDNSDTDAGGHFSSSERSEGGKKKDGSRRGAASAGSSRSQGKKQYRSYGVQTVPKEMRSIAVQVSQPSSTFAGKPSIRQGSRRSSSSSSPAMKTFIDLPRPALGQEMALGLEQSAVTTPNATSPNVQPFSRMSNSRQLGTGMLSPRLHDSFATPPRTSPSGSPGTQTPVSRRASQIAKPPALDTHRLPQLVPMMRRASSADTADSPLGPVSPGDSPVTQLPPSRKPAGRIWNPATGVDVFKRTSEEVLARFLRMGSWEDDASSHK